MFFNNIKYFNDFIDEEGLFLIYEFFCNIYLKVKINFLEYMSVINVIKVWIKKVKFDKKIN